MQKAIDFIVRPHGKVLTFEPKTERAESFVRNDLEVREWQWLGPAIGVNHRLAYDLVASLKDEGFVLEMRIVVTCGV